MANEYGSLPYKQNIVTPVVVSSAKLLIQQFQQDIINNSGGFGEYTYSVVNSAPTVITNSDIVIQQFKGDVING